MLNLGDGLRMLEEVAVDEYLARQRRDRHPNGNFDSAGAGIRPTRNLGTAARGYEIRVGGGPTR